MQEVILSRIHTTVDGMGIIGELTSKGEHLCYTYELRWKNNQRSVSCIPEGRYSCSIHYSPTKRRCFNVRGVYGRSDILIHAGNNYRDTQGCILVGKDFNDNGVLSSRIALGSLLINLPDNFILIIQSKNLIKEV